MTMWWIALGPIGQVFACIAIPATVMLIIQMILTLIGLGGDQMGSDADADGADGDIGGDIADGAGDIGDGDIGDVDAGHCDVCGVDGHGHDHGDILDGGLRVFTLRGLIAFFSVMGWMGTVCCDLELSLPLTIVISALAGVGAMLLIAVLMKWLMRLQDDGTENIKNALGVSGTCYMRIPPARSGKGKVNVIIQGKLCEKDAVTDEETIINREEEITVIGISGEETLIVKRKHRK